MQPWQGESFGNPASQHAAGRRARQAVEDAREEIARILGAKLTGRQADRLVFTSGGSEANNWALLGLAGFFAGREPGEAITSAIEHPSVAEPAELLARHGWTMRRAGVTREGLVDLDALDRVLTSDTRFASVMLANNETGVIQPVREVAERCERARVPLHTDAAQMVGKLPVDFRELGVSAMTVAGHKFHGPLGIGALVLRHDVAIEPFLRGGFQQQALRAGTEPVALIVGMHAALAAWEREAEVRAERMASLRDRLEQRLAAGFEGRLLIHGEGAPRLPHTLSVAFPGLDRQALVMALDLEGVACSTGSACASGSSEPSTVLTAMGVSGDELAGSIRFSLGATTTAQDIDDACARIVRVVSRMRGAGRLTATT